MTNNDGTTLSDMELIIEETSTEEIADENEKTSSAYEQLKERTTEDDDDMTGTLTLRQILGGDHLLVFVRHHVWLILLIVLLTTVYVGFRYQCQKDVIEISDLEKVLTDAKYKALASSSNLTELCRQSNVLKVLRENNDSLLRISDQPPYIINIPEE